MAKYTLYVYAGPHFAMVIGGANTLTNAKKKAYAQVKKYNDSVDILETGDGDVRTMRTIASVYSANYHDLVCYASHSTGKISIMNQNGAIRGIRWEEKDYIGPFN